jgi:pyruvate kinase
MLTADSPIATLQAELSTIRDGMLSAQAAAAYRIADVPVDQRPSAANLVHYVALRQHDARALQDALSTLGLSSLGRAEAHVLATVDAVLAQLDRLGARHGDAGSFVDPHRFEDGRALLRAHADALLPVDSGARGTRHGDRSLRGRRRLRARPGSGRGRDGLHAGELRP